MSQTRSVAGTSCAVIDIEIGRLDRGQGGKDQPQAELISRSSNHSKLYHHFSAGIDIEIGRLSRGQDGKDQPQAEVISRSSNHYKPFQRVPNPSLQRIASEEDSPSSSSDHTPQSMWSHLDLMKKKGRLRNFDLKDIELGPIQPQV